MNIWQGCSCIPAMPAMHHCPEHGEINQGTKTQVQQLVPAVTRANTDTEHHSSIPLNQPLPWALPGIKNAIRIEVR